jgi:large subunit ribosomal protein L30
MLKITLEKSLIGVPNKMKRVVKALGLGKTNSTVTHEDNPSIQGMIFKVQHLVSVERVKK